MKFEQATKKLGHLRSIRSAIQGVIEAAKGVQEEDPALLAAVYDAEDKAALTALLSKTQTAIDIIEAWESQG